MPPDCLPNRLPDCLPDCLPDRLPHCLPSGCYDVYGPGWITVSPKFFKPLSRQALKQANEIKQVIASPDDIDRLRKEVLPHVNQFVPVYLQPVSNGSRAIKWCVEACKRYGYKLSLQTHKLIGVP